VAPVAPRNPISDLPPPSRIAPPGRPVGPVGAPAPVSPLVGTAPAAGSLSAHAQWNGSGGERPATALRPLPQLSPVHPFPPRLSRADRLRRTLLLGGTVVLVATAFRAAPYLTLLVVGLTVLVTRGVSRSEEALHRRRLSRGTKWHDAPRSVLAYPWHVLRGSAGALVLFVVAAGVTVCVTASLVLLGLGTPDALLVGGGCLALMVWEGPGSARVRTPLGRLATTAARNPVATFVVAGALAVLLVATVSAYLGNGVSWTPDDGPPWRHLSSAVSRGLGL
jgi:hypothetical protein